MLSFYINIISFAHDTRMRKIGDNILNEVDPAKCPWWREMHTSGANNTSYPTLLSQLDALRIAGRNADANLRIPVLDRYFEKGCVVMGKVRLLASLMGHSFATWKDS